MTADLGRVNWSAAAVELADEHRRTGAARTRRSLAQIQGLRGRFADDFAVASAATTAAIELEPLDPVHRVRAALALLRFGELDAALAALDALPEGITDLPLVLVVKALVTARRGEARTARNIADRALQVDATHAAARFLYTEQNLAAAAKGGLDKLAELPKGAAYDGAWADLLAKLAISRPGDARAVTAQLDRGVITKGSRADRIARAAIAWAAAAPEELARAAEAQTAGSRAEEVALGLLAAKLASGEPVARAAAFRTLYEKHRDRPAMRRALAAMLTKLAIAEAAAEKFAAAMRAVQVCLDLEPHESTHHQNRAALFVLMGEHESALDAWAELDRHHYRLALLGRLDPASARSYGAPHRMFAQSSRATGRNGVFVREAAEGSHGPSLAVNQEAIDRDPEQLRQWLHHSRAALVFGFAALLGNKERLLLAPATPAIAEARAEGLCALAQSLAMLVPDEGKRLADRLSTHFRAAADGAAMHYDRPEPDADALAVHRHAVELYADLALLAMRWEPDPGRRGAFDEVLETIRAVAPLFDEHVLAGLLEERRDLPPETSGAIAFLDTIMRVTLEVDRRDVALDSIQRAKLAGVLAAALRTGIVERRVIEMKGELGKHEIERLVEELELARRDDARSPRLEYWCAQLLMIGDFLDEAVEAIKRFHATIKDKGEHPLAQRIERVQELIDEKRKHGKGGSRGDERARAGSAGPRSAAEGQRGDSIALAAREADLEAQPTSMQLYTELCHDLALAGRWRDAHAWAVRALARCLSPAGQLRARELALELEGLERLSKQDRGAVASYVAGARAAAVPALEKLDAPDSGLNYVRGLCLLAADRRADAQSAFRRALENCGRGLFLAVLRPLARDVEAAVLDAAKAEIDAALADGRFRDAFSRIAERMATVAQPAPYVLELARTQLAAILPTVGTNEAPTAPSPVRVEAPWRADLANALSLTDAAARTRALAQLAAKIYEPSARDAAALERRLADLEEQLAVAAALDESTRRAAAGDSTGALALLADLGPLGERNARVLRQRAIVLLRLERIAEADAEVAKLAELPEPLAREFAARYPALRFRQRIAAATALVRARDHVAARALLAQCVPAAPDQEIELAYCRAYSAAAEGYAKDSAGDRQGGRALLFDALGLVERVLSEARTLGHERLLELHAKLEADVGAT
ncbi:MAG TPA: hypothetical protein VGM88_00775 [Kofleriaceae bacterium]|jgi:hypothetical protein